MRTIVTIAVVLLAAAAVYGQATTSSSAPMTRPASSPATAATSAGDGEMIQLTFPANVEVKTLVDYVSKRLNMNILYDESMGAKRVTISSPAKIPKDSLLGLLQSVLKIANLAIVDGDQPGWKKIVANQNLLGVTGTMQKDPQTLVSLEAGTPVTQVFEIRSAAIASIESTIKPFLSQPGGNSFPIADKGLLVVTDYAGNLRRIAGLVEMMDKPGLKASIKFVQVKNLDAADLARQVTALLAEKERLAPQVRPLAGKVTLTTEPRSNQIAVVSTEGAETDALQLIESLDVPTSAVTKTYRVKHISPQRIDKLAQDFVGAEPFKKLYKCTVEGESGLMVVTAAPGVHEHIATLIADLDVAGDPTTSHVRFYKLTNATASTVLATIRSLETGETGFGAMDLRPEGAADGRFSGPNYPPAGPGAALPKPPAYQPSSAPASGPAGNGQGGMSSVKTKDAVVTADTNTNTIIVVASPAVQSTYKQLISILDKRRPQVMLEAILVTVDTANSFSLGVELSRKDENGHDILVFSSFGLSTLGADGTPKLVPGQGFNGVLIDPDTINVVVKALGSNTRAKVLSAPKVLVNDNSTATLSSVAEAPFTSINASDTVSTTSFAGYASAGTTITVTPHISEGDHLQLQYAVTLNSFTGQGSAGIPPPRQTNTVNSEVTIPDGYAVIVGGLSRNDVSETVAKVPLLGDIPVIKYLFSSRNNNDSRSTLFVFLRPVILRDDQFEDLKYLSERDLVAAELPSNLPSSEMLLVE